MLVNCVRVYVLYYSCQCCIFVNSICINDEPQQIIFLMDDLQLHQLDSNSSFFRTPLYCVHLFHKEEWRRIYNLLFFSETWERRHVIIINTPSWYARDIFQKKIFSDLDDLSVEITRLSGLTTQWSFFLVTLVVLIHCHGCSCQVQGCGQEEMWTLLEQRWGFLQTRRPSWRGSCWIENGWKVKARQLLEGFHLLWCTSGGGEVLCEGKVVWQGGSDSERCSQGCWAAGVS